MTPDAPDAQIALEHILARIAVVDGWWRGEEPLAEDDWTPEKDHRYRTLFRSRDRHLGAVSYDEARTGYRIGRLAARNPRYADRCFADVDDDLRAGWPESRYDRVRAFVRLGFERARFSRALLATRRRVRELELSLVEEGGGAGPRSSGPLVEEGGGTGPGSSGPPVGSRPT